MTITPIHTLPDELFATELFSRLDGASLAKCEQVCTRFKAIIRDEKCDLWQRCFAAEHHGYIPRTIPDKDWKAFYIQDRRVTQCIRKGRLPEPSSKAFVEPHAVNSVKSGNITATLVNQVVTASDSSGDVLYTLEQFYKILKATDKHLVAINRQDAWNRGPQNLLEVNQASIFESTTGTLLHRIPLHHTTQPFFPSLPAQVLDNHLFGISRDDHTSVSCWDLDTGNIIKRFTPPEGTIFSVTTCDPHRLIITTVRQHTENIGITIWDTENATLLKEVYFQGCSNYVLDGTIVKVHNNIVYFGTWPEDAFHFWDVVSATPIGSLPKSTGYNHGQKWHFDGTTFYVGDKGYDLNQPPQSLLARIGTAVLKFLHVR